MSIRTLIVDDEPLARDRLRAFLGKEPDFEIVGECADGAAAVEAIQRERPDLVFLDVQMPELDGFEVLAALKGADVKLPVVVFVTAFDQHAVKAFEVHALDYLLKPFDRDRFQAALARVRAQIARAQSGDLTDKLTSMLADLQGPGRTAERLVVKTGGKVVFLKAPDVDWIEAADNYVILHVGAESHMLRETLSSVEKRLNPEQFLRISRSVIVNLDRIKELQPLFHGDYSVILKNGTRLTLSRSHRDKLQRLLGK